MKLWFQTQKHFFFFRQSTHFQVLHYTQNKYLKKTFTKLKTLTMLHAMGAKGLGFGGVMWRGSKGDEVGWVGLGGSERGKEVKGQKKVNVLQLFPPWCHIRFVTQ